LPIYEKMEKVAKNGRKVKGIALLFFAYLWKMEKVAKNGRKVKGIALLLCCFFAYLWKMEKSR
jgi:hypothetical protein